MSVESKLTKVVFFDSRLCDSPAKLKLHNLDFALHVAFAEG